MNLKKVIYNANHRGLKEMDILLGSFASNHLGDLPSQEQLLFEQLLTEQDADILDWCLGKTTPPDQYRGLIINVKKSKS